MHQESRIQFVQFKETIKNILYYNGFHALEVILSMTKCLLQVTLLVLVVLFFRLPFAQKMDDAVEEY